MSWMRCSMWCSLKLRITNIFCNAHHSNDTARTKLSQKVITGFNFFYWVMTEKCSPVCAS